MNKLTKHNVFTIPNILSLFRIMLIPLIIFIYCNMKKNILAGLILLLSGLTDIIDGYIARHFNMTSNLGKILDPIADKLTQVSILICLTFEFKWMIVPIICIILKEVFVGASGIFVIKAGTVMGADWHGKIATILLHLTIVLHIFYPSITPQISISLALACAIMINISFLLYMKRNIVFLKRQNKNTA